MHNVFSFHVEHWYTCFYRFGAFNFREMNSLLVHLEWVHYTLLLLLSKISNRNINFNWILINLIGYKLVSNDKVPMFRLHCNCYIQILKFTYSIHYALKIHLFNTYWDDREKTCDISLFASIHNKIRHQDIKYSVCMCVQALCVYI